jgi:hypothetical protein
MWGRFHDLLGKAHLAVTHDRRGYNATASGSKVRGSPRTVETLVMRILLWPAVLLAL